MLISIALKNSKLLVAATSNKVANRRLLPIFQASGEMLEGRLVVVVESQQLV